MSNRVIGLQERSQSLPILQKRQIYLADHQKKKDTDHYNDETKQTIQLTKQLSDRMQFNSSNNTNFSYDQRPRQSGPERSFKLQRIRQFTPKFKSSDLDKMNQIVNLKTLINQSRASSLPQVQSDKPYSVIYWEQRQKAIANMTKLSQMRKREIQLEVELELRRKNLNGFNSDKKKEVEEEIRSYLRNKIGKALDYAKIQRSVKIQEYKRKYLLENSSKFQAPYFLQSQNDQRGGKSTNEEYQLTLRPKYNNAQQQNKRNDKVEKRDQKEPVSKRRKPRTKTLLAQEGQQIDEIDIDNIPETHKKKKPRKTKTSQAEEVSQLQEELVEKKIKSPKKKYDLKNRSPGKQSNRKMEQQISQSLQDNTSELILQNAAFKKHMDVKKTKELEQKLQRKKRIQAKLQKEADKLNQLEEKKGEINQFSKYPKKRKLRSQSDLQSKFDMKLMQNQILEKTKKLKEYITSQSQEEERRTKLRKKLASGLYQNIGFKLQASKLTSQKSLSKRLSIRTQRAPSQQTHAKLIQVFPKIQKIKPSSQIIQIDRINVNQNIQIIQIKGQYNLQKYFDLHYQKIPDLIKKVNYCHSNINWLVYTLVKQTKSFTIFQYKKKQTREIGIVVAVCKQDYYKEQRGDQNDDQLFVKNNLKARKQARRRVNLIHIGAFKENNTLELIYACANAIFHKDPCSEIYFSFGCNSDNDKEYMFLSLFDEEFQKIGFLKQKLGSKHRRNQRRYLLTRERFYEAINKKQLGRIKPDIVENLDELYCSIELIAAEEFLGVDEKIKNSSHKFIVPGLVSLFLSQYMSSQKIKELQLLQNNESQSNLVYRKQLLNNLAPLKPKFKEIIKTFTYLRTKRYENPLKLIQKLRKQGKSVLPCIQTLYQRAINCYQYLFLQQIMINYRFSTQNIKFGQDNKNEYSCRYFRFNVQNNIEDLENKKGHKLSQEMKQYKIQRVLSSLNKKIQLFLLPSTKPQYKIVIMNLDEFDKMNRSNQGNLNQFIFDFVQNATQRARTEYDTVWIPQIEMTNRNQKDEVNWNQVMKQSQADSEVQKITEEAQQKEEKLDPNTYFCEQTRIIPNFQSKIVTKFGYYYKTYLHNSLVYQPKIETVNKKNITTTDSQTNSKSSKKSPPKNTQKGIFYKTTSNSSDRKQLFIKPPFLMGVMDSRLLQQTGNGLLFAKRIDVEDVFQLEKVPVSKRSLISH